jgi:hypothetical protein
MWPQNGFAVLLLELRVAQLQAQTAARFEQPFGAPNTFERQKCPHRGFGRKTALPVCFWSLASPNSKPKAQSALGRLLAWAGAFLGAGPKLRWGQKIAFARFSLLELRGRADGILRERWRYGTIGGVEKPLTIASFMNKNKAIIRHIIERLRGRGVNRGQ